MARAPKVLVFDSGVGGLSVLAALRARAPGCELVFACDNAAFPYGTKTEAELIERVDEVLHQLVRREQPDLLVVACNTASTVALPRLRARIPNPVVGVVPAIKPAAALSATKVIGLLGTPGTVSRPYTRQLIADFAAACEVISVGSSRLVEIAEQALRGTAPDSGELRAILDPLFANPALDTLILACTHFPLLAADLAQAAPRPVHWVDSGDAVARRVLTLLGCPAEGPTDGPDRGFRALFTDAAGSDALQPALTARGCRGIAVLP